MPVKLFSLKTKGLDILFQPFAVFVDMPVLETWPDRCVQDPPSYILLFLIICSYCKRSISLNEIQCITTLSWWPASCVLSKSVLATLLFMRSFSHVFSWKLFCLLATFGGNSSEGISVHLRGDRPMCPVSPLPCRDLCCNQVVQGHGLPSALFLARCSTVLDRWLFTSSFHIHSFYSFRMRPYSRFKNIREFCFHTLP